MATERKTARYRTQGTLQSCSFFTLGKAFDEQEKSPVLVRRFATDLFADDADWRQFHQTLQEFSQVAISGLLPVRQIGGQVRQPWLILGGTEGATLHDRLAAEPSSRLLDWLESIANTLTELHASGHVHGRVQPNVIFFSQDNRPCLDEIASIHALCAWDMQHHDVPQNLIGELFSSAYLAPELRNGGEVTPQSDQYSLAVVLVECLTGQSLDVVNLIGCQSCETALAYLAAEAPKSRRSVVELLRPVLTRALADDPQQRFPTCRDFFSAVRQSQREKSHRHFIRVAAMAAIVFVSLALVAGKRELDRRNLLKEQARLNESAKEQTRVSEHKAIIRREISQKYQSGFPNSKLVNLSLLTDFGELLSAPESTDFVEILLNAQSSSSGTPSRNAPKLLSKPLSQGPAPRVTLTIDSVSNTAPTVATTASATDPSETKEPFIFSETGKLERLSAPTKITWTAVVALPASVRPRQSDSVRVALVDGEDNIIGEKQTAQFSTSSYSSSTTLKGTLPNTTNLKFGDLLRAKVWLLENGQEKIEWPQSNAFWVGEVSTKTRTIELNPLNVREAAFQLNSGVKVDIGDKIRLIAVGNIFLGVPKVYSDMKLERRPIPPEGLRVIREEIPEPWIGVSYSSYNPENYSSDSMTLSSEINSSRYDKYGAFSMTLSSEINSSRYGKYGALLAKIGDSHWVPYNPQSTVDNQSVFTLSNIKTSGTLFLSLDGIYKIAQRKSLGRKDGYNRTVKGAFSANDARELTKNELQDFWSGDGAFRVTIITQSAKFPNATSEATKQKVRSSLSF